MTLDVRHDMTAIARRVLVVDDDPAICSMLSVLLEREGLDVKQVHDGRMAMEALHLREPDLLLLDINIPAPDGMEVLRQAGTLYPRLPVVVITAYAGVGGAVEAIKAGAYDYIPKPFNNKEVARVVKRAIGERERIHRIDHLPQATPSGERLFQLMGHSASVERLVGDVVRVGGTEFSVIIHGETGSGKELIAHAIHSASARAKGPFVAVDCGAIPETLIENELFGHERGAFTGAHQRQIGKFEAARGGTLFLDEAGNLPLSAQARLLRAIQERVILRVGGSEEIRIDLRIVVASNQDLGEAVAAGTFRQDLLYRLNEYTIRIPPLRERKEDIEYLARRFLLEVEQELHKTGMGFTPEAMARMLSHAWPGNVREFRTTIRHAALMADSRIGVEHLRLPGSGATTETNGNKHGWLTPEGPSLKEMVDRHTDEIQRELILRALRQTRGNKAEVARLLKIDYKTILAKLKKFGITTEELFDGQHEKA